jgi:hypothetical protein
MKRIIIMLLIACSAITTVSADPTATAPQKKPEAVIAALNSVANTHGDRQGQVYSVEKNPNTGIIESSMRIVPISATMAGKGPYFSNIARAFMHDESLSYQFLHIQPGSTQYFLLDITDKNGVDNNTLHLRTKTEQEMWLMCCKNPDNPQLRDAYAVVWEVDYNGRKPMDTGSYPMKGTIYMVTSLRPDVFQKNMSSAGLLSDNKNTFTIDGRVGYDLNDSLYVVYMADTAEELDKVADDAYVAEMPVVNKRFSFSVQLDKRKVGRIRTVMPDGSLCKLWTNLDFVPGEIYRITTHNGYYDEDRDYEQRVGRNSGKSLLNDLQRRGIDDQTVEVADSIPVEFRVVPEGDVAVNGVRVIEREPDNMDAWLKTISPEKKAMLMFKGKEVEAGIERIKMAYRPLGEIINNGMPFNIKITDSLFKNIYNQNKNLDKSIQEFQKAFFALNPPAKLRASFYADAFKEILETFTKQNQGFTEIYTKTGNLSKTAQKTQKYINKLIDKYVEEMKKSFQ